MEIVVKAADVKTPAMQAEEAADPLLEWVKMPDGKWQKERRSSPRPVAASAIDQLELDTVFPERLGILASDNNITHGDRVLVNSHVTGKVIRVLEDGAFRVQVGEDENNIVTAWKQELQRLKD
jgi:hypothetical protein